RATAFQIPNSAFQILVAAERLPEVLAVHPDATLEPPIVAPPSRAARTWTRDEAIVELLKGRVTILGPTTALALAESLSIAGAEPAAALRALESEGIVLRGAFTRKATAEHAENAEKVSVSASSANSAVRAVEWCDRRLLARIHRYTLNRLRAEIEPVSPADFMRFLFAWQHAAPGQRLTGSDGLREVIDVLNGFEAPAVAWERTILPARVEPYDAPALDMLGLTGEIAWARASAPSIADTDPSALVASTPITLFPRAHAAIWLARDGADAADAELSDPRLQAVVQTLRSRGASFGH